jgi:hypothetical protein
MVWLYTQCLVGIRLIERSLGWDGVIACKEGCSKGSEEPGMAVGKDGVLGLQLVYPCFSTDCDRSKKLRLPFL